MNVKPPKPPKPAKLPRKPPDKKVGPRERARARRTLRSLSLDGGAVAVLAEPPGHPTVGFCDVLFDDLYSSR